MATPLTVRVVEHQAQIFRRFWRGSATFYILNPVLFLAAIGFGLGGLVPESTGNVGGVPYDAFVAPGLLAASAMLGATAESMWPVMAGTKWVRTFHAMVATPVRPADVYAGVVAWTTVRSAVGGYGRFLALAEDGIRQTAGFGEPEQRRYPWEQTYTRDAWLDQLPTSGFFAQIPPDTAKAVIEGIGDAVDAAGGAFTMRYTTVVVTAERIPAA